MLYLFAISTRRKGFDFYFITNMESFLNTYYALDFYSIITKQSKVMFKLVALVEFLKPVFAFFFDQELFIQQLIFNFWRR